MNAPTMRAAAACALLATTALSGLIAQPAAAQSGVAPGARPAPDSNGVDVITGELNMPLRSVSIGRPGESGLSYVSGFSNGARNDSFILEMTAGGPSAVGNIQGRVVTFSKNSAGVYVPEDGDGSTLVPWGDDFIYTARDGTRIEFLNEYGDALGVGARGNKIIRPDGEVITLHYKVAPPPACPNDEPCLGSGGVRVQAMTNSLGFQLKATYASNIFEDDSNAWSELTKVTAINSAVDFCNPAADNCPTFSKAWPALTLSRSEGASATTDTFVDNLSNGVTVTSTAGSPTSITSPASPAADISLTYDANQRVATVVRGGGTWGYSYADGSGQRTTTVTQPLGGNRTYVSDLGLSRVRSETDELGRTTSYDYDANGRLTRTTFPEGNYVQLTYDVRGNVTQTRSVAKAGSGLADIVTSSSFPTTCSNAKVCNKPTSVTDARGATTDFTYDANHGGLLTATLAPPATGAVRPQSRMTYSQLSAYYKNFQGTIVPAITPVYRLTATSTCQTTSSCAATSDEIKSTVVYGSVGTANNLLPTGKSTGNGTGALTANVAQTYDAFGNVLTVDGPLAGAADTIRYRYDAVRRPVGMVSPDPDGAGTLKHRAQRVTYDADGQVTKAESGTVNSQSDADWAAFVPIEAQEAVYDTLGRAVTRKLVAGGVVHALSQTSYDAKGRPLCTAQRMNPNVFASLAAGACDQATAGTFGPDRITKAIYDAANQVTQTKVGVGTLDEANERSLTYTANGRTASLTDAENNKTSYSFDGFDRLSATYYPVATKGAATSNTADYEGLQYDANGNVTSRRLRDTNSIAYGYDSLNRPTLKNLPGSEPDVSYTYDLAGRLLTANQPGQALSFTYDALGRNLTQVSALGTVTSQWDVAGRRTQLTYPGSGLFIAYDHLVTGELKSIRENGATSGVGLLATYSYDDLGRRTSLARGNGTATSYAYDPVSRLADMTHDLASNVSDLNIGSITYNPASQINTLIRSNDAYAWTGPGSGSTSTISDGLNRPISVGGAVVQHDSKGNLTTDPTAGKTYAYSSENLLISSTGGTATSLTYDPAMRLAQIAAGTTTRFGYDGLNLIMEQDGAGAVIKRYVHGSRPDEPLMQYEGSGLINRRWLYADERGSIVGLGDENGNSTAINRYDEFGNIQNANSGRFQYTGQAWLSEIGSYNYKARMYSPQLGRFLQTDPIGYSDGMNIYSYVRGDPINAVDPSGLSGEAPKEACGTVTGSRIVRCGEAYGLALESAGWTGEYTYEVNYGANATGGVPFQGGRAYLTGLVHPASNTGGPMGSAYFYAPTLSQLDIGTIHLTPERYAHIYRRHGPHVTTRGHFSQNFFSMGVVGFAQQMRSGFNNLTARNWDRYFGPAPRALELELRFGRTPIGWSGPYGERPDAISHTVLMRILCFGSQCAVDSAYPIED